MSRQGRRPIRSRDELAAYLADDEIACLECGRRFRALGRHLRLAHGISPQDYRRVWGLPAGTPLMGRSAREERSAVARRLVAEGTIGRFASAASEAARDAGRGQRTDWELAEQGARAAAIPQTTLPPGAKRADGRDADRAREYQREYRKTYQRSPK